MSEQPTTLLSPRVFLPFALVTLIWGSTWIVIKGQLGVVPPSWSVTYRFVVAGAAMFVFAAARRERLWLEPRAMAFAAVLGLAQFALNFNFVYRAEQHITSGLVAVLFALLIVPNTLLGRLFLKTPLERRFLAGAGIAIVGVALMILHEYRAAALGADEVIMGTLLTLAGVMSASTANVMQGTGIARAQSMVVMIAWAMLFGALADGSYAWITTGPPVIEKTGVYLGGILYLGIIASAVTFPLYFNVIRAVGPGQAAWSSVLIPIIAMGFSTVFEGYRWAPLSIAGGIVALIGLVIAVAKRPERPSVSGNMVSVPVDPD
ncbi:MULTISPECIES: DMT family transporter [unclassified Sphingopyxis]|uniref:DMT family transporter n=1 Tax=unclassified Sphingopyxis TaxID=2614943 RepID=UPI0007315DB5|nr:MULTISPECIES: DMT family transporter [unclassified Sphingopyxis]MBD3733047.1 EamA family transporter [Sphingopyxis sp.]KTE26599.1 multidrug transporter [Sphingopyxis sp. H057]KTE53005.1 multidrug transporter [Sphingopyxis sp. H073]KTE55195.1 multidrug transporter [Sphingopyxis sp. H071]KTE58684.1 multidrug transporter [Sphingopyxis sp. H107]